MRMNWYYRMILSYTPIFFVAISSMIFIFFLILNNATKDQYIEMNNAILKRMVYNSDANLMLIERNIASELLTNSVIQDYYSERPKSAHDYYMLQKQLIELKSRLPYLNTIYLYQEAEKRIISDAGSYTLDEFGDRAFLLSRYGRHDKAASGQWHAPRAFAYSESDNQRPTVISLVKMYEEGSEPKGAMVVNVYLNSFLDYLNSFSEDGRTPVRLAEARGSPAEAKASTVAVHSDYTGWTYLYEGVYDNRFEALSVLSSAWMIILIVIIILSLIGFTAVTHMHYKPIQSIMEKVARYANRKSGQLGIKSTDNEFAFIETALDQLLQRSLDYESLHKEDSMLKRQRLFHDLLAGHQIMTDDEFKRRLEELGLPHPYDRLGVMVAEIDDYASFTARYKLRDQHLLKFIIESAFHDLGQQNDTFVWHVWIEPHQIAFVMHLVQSGRQDAKTARAFAEEFQKWIQKNLELTITIGVGADSDTIETIADSFRNERENAALKPIFGRGAIIDNRRSAGKRSLDNDAYLQALKEAAHSFRMSDSEWREKLARVFAELKEARFTKRDISLFVGSFVQQMSRAISGLSPGIQRFWADQYRPRFVELQQTAETLNELEELVMNTMTQLENAVDEDRKARRHHSIAMQAKSYIDTHYADPDLSLTRVSEYLKMQPSTLSQLFKEELGEKFIDYVLKVRMQHARKLLVETDDAIQSIAEQIGYQNVISFYRAFKKDQNMPPGEYRNMHRTN